MTPQEATVLVGRLKAMYPRQTVDESTIVGYAHYLADLDPDEASAAVDELVATSTWFPTVAEIRGVVAERKLGLPGPMEAFALAMEIATEVDKHYDLPEDVRWAVCRAMSTVGGSWSMRASQSPDTLRAQYGRAYEEIRDALIRDARLDGLVLPAAPKRAELEEATR